jgi:hypothetical protein
MRSLQIVMPCHAVVLRCLVGACGLAAQSCSLGAAHHARPRPRRLQASEAAHQQAIVLVSEKAIFLCDPPVLRTSISAEGSLEQPRTALNSEESLRHTAAGAGVLEFDTSSTGSVPSEEVPDESTSESCSALGCGGRAHLRCAGCLSACYCSDTCQSAHWKVHRKPCRAIAGRAASACVAV